MSMVQGTQSGTPAADLSALLQLAATQQGSTKALDVKDLEESLNALRSFLAAGRILKSRPRRAAPRSRCPA